MSLQPRRTLFAKLIIWNDMKEAQITIGYIETFGWREREVVTVRHWFKIPQKGGTHGIPKE